MNKYIIFKNNQRSFAIHITKIEKIIQKQKMFSLPETPSYFLGVIQYNEIIIPIIDLNQRLFSEKNQSSEDDKLIIVSWQNQRIGLIVSVIIGIQDIEENQIEFNLEESGGGKSYLSGLIKTETDIIILLDVDQLFSEKISQEIKLSLNEKKFSE